MTLTTINAGVDTSFHTKLNTNFNTAYSKVVASTPYTGTGFNANRGTNGTTTNNTTLTVAASTIQDYIRIVCVVKGYAQCSVSNATSALASLKIETSVASAGSWTTRFDEYVFRGVPNYPNGGGVHTVELYYAPTSGEKSGGLDIRITGTADCVVGAGTTNADITNVQTMVFAN